MVDWYLLWQNNEKTERSKKKWLHICICFKANIFSSLYRFFLCIFIMSNQLNSNAK